MQLERFDMLDEVLALDATGGCIRLRATVPRESPVFEGHFPGHPILPGVLMVEVIAQASGLLQICRTGALRMPVLMAIDRARFRRFARPGDVLDVSASIVTEGAGYVATTGRIEIGSDLVCDVAMRLRLADIAPFARFIADNLRKLNLSTCLAERTA